MAKARTSQPASADAGIARKHGSAAPDIGMYCCTYDGAIIYMDSTAAALFDLGQEVAGRNLRDLLRLEPEADLFPSSLRRKKRLSNVSRKITTVAGELRELVEDYYVVSGDQGVSVHVVTRRIPPRGEYSESNLRLLLRESDARYRTTINGLADGIHLIDSDLRVVLANGSFLDWLDSIGVDQDIIGKPVTEALPFLSQEVLDNYKKIFQSGKMFSTEATNTVSGRTITADIRLIPVKEHGAVKYIITVIREVTETRKAEKALRSSEERYRSILENIQEGYYEVDLRGNITFLNSAACRIFGYSMDELISMNYRQYYADPAAEKEIAGVFARIYETGEPADLYDWHIVRRDGSRAVVELSVSLLRDDKGHRAGFRGIARDVTERKAAEKALREAEQRNRAIVDAIPDSMVRLSRDGVILDFKLDTPGENEQWHVRGLMNKSIHEAMGVAIGNMTVQHARLALKTKTMQVFEFQNMGRSTGIMRDHEVRMVVCGQDEVMGITRDITKQKRAEKALRESEQRYRELFENANDVIYTHDLDGRFTSLNKAGERLSGYTREEACQMNVLSAVAPEYVDRISQKIASKLDNEDATQYELEIVTKDQRRVLLEVSTRIIYKDGAPHAIQGIGRDITERRRAEEDRKRLEAQIQHAQKLEGLGVLAGGIAHDFNNLLVGMMGYAGLALTKLTPESIAFGYVEKIETSAQRAAELTNQLLAYSGRSTFIIKPLNLSTLAVEMGRLLSASISKKAVLKYNCSPDIPLIHGDAAQLHQVIMNLITNASDAIGDDPGVITISARPIKADTSYLSKTFLDDKLAEGLYVCLEVSDNGCGMDATTLQRIFDPFFTTKFTGRGLGLAAVLGIVRGHKGAIKVYSEPGNGTTFKILFPAMDTVAEVSAISADSTKSKDALAGWKGAGTLLVADDETTALQVAKDVLETYGYKVVGAANGKEAVEVFQQYQDEIVAVLLDLMMPIMNGEEAYELIHAIRPNIPVVLSSGYTEQDVSERFAGKGPVAFIQKPYVLQDLAKKLREVIEKTQ